MLTQGVSEGALEHSAWRESRAKQAGFSAHAHSITHNPQTITQRHTAYTTPSSTTGFVRQQTPSLRPALPALLLLLLQPLYRRKPLLRLLPSLLLVQP